MQSIYSRLLVAFLLLSVVPSTGCRAPYREKPDADAALDNLLRQMNRRLVLMHDVARWKWNAKKPIADPGREEELLLRMEDRWKERGQVSDVARSFFAAQIEAAKLVQQADFERWRAEGREGFAVVTDLPQLREKIDQINDEMLEALVILVPSWSMTRKTLAERADRALTGEGITATVRETALAPLERLGRP